MESDRLKQIQVHLDTARSLALEAIVELLTELRVKYPEWQVKIDSLNVKIFNAGWPHTLLGGTYELVRLLTYLRSLGIRLTTQEELNL